MNANGLYSGVEGYVIPGTNSGVGGGVANGLYGVDYERLKLLDLFPGAIAAYSVRRLRTQYTGPALRVRRSSDSAELDILFDVNGNINENQLKAFVGSSDGFVSVWYDQSGNGINASQASAGSQPRIVLSGTIKKINNRVSVEDVTGGSLNTSSNIVLTHAFTVGKINTLNAVNYIVGSSTVGLFYGGSAAGVNGLGGFDGTNAVSITGEDLNPHLGYFSIRGSLLYVARDGQAESGGGGAFTSFTINRIFGRGLGGLTSFFGDIQELIFYNTDQSINRLGIDNNINQYYKIY